MTAPFEKSIKLQRRILQPMLMALAVIGSVTVVATTLRSRPDIQPPQYVNAPYRSTGFQQTLTIVNEQLADLARQNELPVAPPEDNLAIARRISLALVGSGLSLEEVRALSSVPEQEQIQWWTSYLLESHRWADYFSERFSRTFVGTDEGPFLVFRRRRFRLWLAEQFREHTPYDSIVRSMISAEGLWTDTPQVNFVTATMEEDNSRGDPIRLAGRTSRVFLAQRIDCLQCHDDFLGNLNFGTEDEPVDGVQDHFHSLAAFYAGTAVSEFVLKGIREDAETYKYQFLGEDEEREVLPQVPFAQALLPAAGKPRERLASWVTHPENLAFSRATVNRVWALLFSRPLVSPVDNIPLDASVPEIMDTLARDFSGHGFDLHRLLCMIIESDAFQRSSRAEFEVTTAHEDSWAVFPVTQLRPEQVFGSMFQANKLAAFDSFSSIITQLQSFGEQQDFLKRFGDRGEDEFDSEAVTVSQRLVMMNGNLVADRTKVDLINNASTRIAAMVGDDRQVIELVFLSTLNRYPTASEVNAFVRHIEEKKGKQRSRAVGDIYWAIINSTEFSWNH